MAAVTIMAIIAFVFLSGPMVGSLNRGGSEPPAYRTKYGNLTMSYIGVLRQQRALLRAFFQSLVNQLRGNQQAMGNVMAVNQILGPDTTEAAVNFWVYARTAEAMGMVVDNDSINGFLNALTLGSNDPQGAVNAALQQTQQGMSSAELFSLLRDPLLSMRLLQLGHQCDDLAGRIESWTAMTTTPGERWDYFKRLSQKATVEVAMFLPRDFAKDVKDPSDDELRQFFDKYKDFEAVPDSPRPGFRVPRKVNVEYLEGDPKNYESRVTEDEITQNSRNILRSTPAKKKSSRRRRRTRKRRPRPRRTQRRPARKGRRPIRNLSRNRKRHLSRSR